MYICMHAYTYAQSVIYIYIYIITNNKVINDI